MPNTPDVANRGGKVFREPRPNRALMWASAFLVRWRMLTGLPLLRRLPFIRDLPLVRGHFHLRHIDMPPDDRARLARAVNPGTAAFIAPNHPEFGLDWMLDKELSSMVAPRMASWADAAVVRSAPVFWSWNHLIANDGGQHAVEYSVRCALRGDAVLLHPEGAVHWTANRVHPLFRGVVEMALEAARRAGADRPVYIVPVVWKYLYIRDVSADIHAELDVMERALGIPCRAGLDVAERFFGLHEAVLERQASRFGHATTGSGDFFARQEALRDALLEQLSRRYSIEPTGLIERDILRYRKAINATPARSVEDLAIADEALRLSGFTRADYGAPVLTQEQIHESLKRMRAALMRRGRRQTFENLLPRPFGPRVAYVRVPEPILVDSRRSAEGRYADQLLEATRDAMQAALSAIRNPYAVPTWPNPFHLRIPNPSQGGIVSRKDRCQAPFRKADLADPPPLSRTG